jgi:hypothetical protein
MGKFTINENGKIQYNDGRGLKYLNVLGLDDKYFLHHDETCIIAEERFGMILCKRVRTEQDEKRLPEDFYDENNEANLLEKEMISSYEGSFKDILVVLIGIIAIFGVSYALNYLINLL